METLANTIVGQDAELLFNTSYGLKLNAEGVAKELVNFMHADPKRAYKIVIGTDSLLAADKSADFVTAVVVHRVGNGGRYFWRRIELKSFYTLRDRIIREVLLSLEIAQNILSALKDANAPQFEFEIHADIGENGPTKATLQEVIGMIRAHNFEPKTKPYSFAASNVADRHV